MLNILWPIFIIISVIYSICSGNLQGLNNSIFESVESVIDVSLTLLGLTCLWNGIMEIALNTGVVKKISIFLSPIVKKLFPGIQLEENSFDCIVMNIVANMLGLGNAATPLGLKAIDELQKDNLDDGRLSDNMMMLIVLNTASLQIIPTSVIAIRSSLGSSNPTKIIFPVWISTICSAIVGVSCCKILIKCTKNERYK